MSARHTPGPWTTDGSARGGDLDIIAPSGRVALIDCESRGSFQSEAVLESNARLIVVAPELLAALQDMVDAYQRHFDVMPVAWQTYDNIARAAIAKATGAE